MDEATRLKRETAEMMRRQFGDGTRSDQAKWEEIRPRIQDMIRAQLADPAHREEGLFNLECLASTGDADELLRGRAG